MSGTTAGDRAVVSLIDERQEYHGLQAAEAREAGRRAGPAVEVLFAENTSVLQIQQAFRHVHARRRSSR